MSHDFIALRRQVRSRAFFTVRLELAKLSALEPFDLRSGRFQFARILMSRMFEFGAPFSEPLNLALQQGSFCVRLGRVRLLRERVGSRFVREQRFPYSIVVRWYRRT